MALGMTVRKTVDYLCQGTAEDFHLFHDGASTGWYKFGCGLGMAESRLTPWKYRAN